MTLFLRNLGREILSGGRHAGLRPDLVELGVHFRSHQDDQANHVDPNHEDHEPAKRAVGFAIATDVAHISVEAN